MYDKKKKKLFLEKINSPEDLKSLNIEDLKILSVENYQITFLRIDQTFQ